MCSLTRHIGLKHWRLCWDVEPFARSMWRWENLEWSCCITDSHDFSNSICVRFSRSKYWNIRQYLSIVVMRLLISNKFMLHLSIWSLKGHNILPSKGYILNYLLSQSYLERTSCVKNNCKGQSTEYSRAIPSQPSRDVSSEVSDDRLESPSTYLDLDIFTLEDLMLVPIVGILKVV